MKKDKFLEFLRTHYRRGKGINRVQFLRAFNVFSKLHGGGEVSPTALNSWIDRGSPANWCGEPFESFLKRVRTVEVMKVEKIYRIDFPADAQTVAALEKACDGVRAEDFLLGLLVLAVEDELEIPPMR